MADWLGTPAWGSWNKQIFGQSAQSISLTSIIIIINSALLFDTATAAWCGVQGGQQHEHYRACNFDPVGLIENKKLPLSAGQHFMHHLYRRCSQGNGKKRKDADQQVTAITGQPTRSLAQPLMALLWRPPNTLVIRRCRQKGNGMAHPWDASCELRASRWDEQRSWFQAAIWSWDGLHMQPAGWAESTFVYLQPGRVFFTPPSVVVIRSSNAVLLMVMMMILIMTINNTRKLSHLGF